MLGHDVLLVFGVPEMSRGGNRVAPELASDQICQLISCPRNSGIGPAGGGAGVQRAPKDSREVFPQRRGGAMEAGAVEAAHRGYRCRAWADDDAVWVCSRGLWDEFSCAFAHLMPENGLAAAQRVSGKVIGSTDVGGS